jgi:hypothetical protein
MFATECDSLAVAMQYEPVSACTFLSELLSVSSVALTFHLEVVPSAVSDQ